MGRYGTPDLSTGKKDDSEFIKCKKCGHEYYRTWNHCPECRTPKGKGNVRPIFLILLAAVILFALYETDIFDFSSNKNIITSKTSLDQQSEQNNTNYNDVTAFTEIPVQSPPTGMYQLFTNNELLAPFLTKNHNDDYCYLLKFINTNDKSTVLTIFLNKNENCDVKVPLGTYEILVAIGETWYGDKHLFGPSTQFQKYDNIYNFYSDGYQYQGWFIDLQPQEDGNLKSNYISKDDFM